MKTCLIAEDNPVNWMAAQNICKKLGFETFVCENGRDALTHCEQRGLPDLIVLDGYMPEMNGLEFLHAFVDLPGQEAVLVVFCSSSMERDDIEEALRIRADCHIPKPIDQERLVDELMRRSLISDAA